MLILFATVHSLDCSIREF